MGPDDWSVDNDVARWEALEAEARAEQDGGTRGNETVRVAPEADAVQWWQEPLADAPADGTVDSPDPVPSAPAADVLLADADAAIGASIEQAMTDRGWIVRRVDNGELALAEFLRQPPDCFVFDYSLPGLGGLDLLRKLGEHGVGDGTRLVVNSVQTQTIHVQRALALGANRFLDRPRRSPAPLVDAVAEQLEELGVLVAADRPAGEPAAAPRGPETGGDGLFAGAPAPAPPSVADDADRSEANPASTDEGRSYRSAFGSGGGPPGRIPRLS
jgi:CheY-like chemotaxis protein